jgi:hypothetical protein
MSIGGWENYVHDASLVSKISIFAVAGTLFQA